jgi:hypothetical protein
MTVTKRRLSLADLQQQQAAERSALARAKGGRMRGLQRAANRFRKAAEIWKAVGRLRKEGLPVHHLNKIIAVELGLEVAYVTRVTKMRRLMKEG